MTIKQVNPRYVILSRLAGKAKRGRQNDSGDRKAGTFPGFLPVEITGFPETTKEQVEVIFPDGVRLVLSGPQNMSMLGSILKDR